jgi:hypothetical protein
MTFRFWDHSFLASVLVCVAASIANGQDRDSDGDGLSDFQETHKYLTDPNTKDSDGDGIEDGDWHERREFQYIIRSVTQVMKPVTIEYLNDDYQDARILDETEAYVELETIHYPFNTVASTISEDQAWRKSIDDPSLELAQWLQPGPTSDWTPELKSEIENELAKDGIELEELSDQQLAEKVSKWLLKRAEYHDGFSAFSTAFDDEGNPYIPEARKDDVGKGSSLTPEQQWESEISAAGMFRNKVRGSCSSSAIYLSGCLRAVGLPTRTILCIPIVDANDEKEIEMIRRLKQSGVRRDLLSGILPLKGLWASHTYNEVFVGGRWRRLNYDRLGQNTYDPGMFGLMTHVATFNDWADARMWETIGARETNQGGGDVFGGPNPYSTISLRDEVGPHCKIELPEADVVTLSVEQIHWTDSKDLPDEIRENCQRKGRFGLIADVAGFKDGGELDSFLAQADLRVIMEVQDRGEVDDDQNLHELKIGFDRRCFWVSNNLIRIFVPLGGGDQRDLVKGVTYRFQPRNNVKDFQWLVGDELTIVRD